VTFGRLHVAPRLGEFLGAHPELHLELVMDDRRIDLLEQNIDVALRLGELVDSSLTARKLATSDRLVVASRAYLDRCGEPQVPSDLMAHESVVFSLQTASGDDWRLRQGATEISVRTPSRISVTAAEGFREAILAGLGVAIAPRWMMRRELDSGEVRHLLPGWTLPPVDIWAIYPSGRMPTAKAKAFVAWFESQFAG
jgi:DNA-binding transcriptional LysR family regulator